MEVLRQEAKRAGENKREKEPEGLNSFSKVKVLISPPATGGVQGFSDLTGKVRLDLRVSNGNYCVKISDRKLSKSYLDISRRCNCPSLF
jgi:hypothetical protein